jgi:hypothetical protein
VSRSVKILHFTKLNLFHAHSRQPRRGAVERRSPKR